MAPVVKTMIYMGRVYVWDAATSQVTTRYGTDNIVIGSCKCVKQIDDVIHNYHLKLTC